LNTSIFLEKMDGLRKTDGLEKTDGLRKNRRVDMLCYVMI